MYRFFFNLRAYIISTDLVRIIQVATMNKIYFLPPDKYSFFLILSFIIYIYYLLAIA